MAKEAENEDRQVSDPNGGSRPNERDSENSDEHNLEIPSPDLPSPSSDSETSRRSSDGSGATRLGSDDDGEAPVPPPPPTDVESGRDEPDSGFKEMPETGEVDPVTDGDLPSPPDSDGSEDETVSNEVAGNEDSEGSSDSKQDEALDEPALDETVPPESSSGESEEEDPPSANTLLDRDRDFESSDEPPGDPTDILEKSELREAFDDENSGTDPSPDSEPEGGDPPEHDPTDGSPEDSLDPSASPSPPDRDLDATAEDYQLDPGADEDRTQARGTDVPDPEEPTPHRPKSAPSEEVLQPTPPIGNDAANPPESSAPSDESENAEVGEERPSGETATRDETEGRDIGSGAGPSPSRKSTDDIRVEETQQGRDASQAPESATTSSTDSEPEAEARPPVHTDDVGAGLDFDGFLSRGPRIAATLGALLLGLLLGAFVITSAVVTRLDGNRLRRALEQAELAPNPDTYRAWRDAYDATAVGSRESSKPGSFRSKLHWIGDLVGVDPPSDFRHQLRARRAYYAAVLEYRFEHHGSRRSDSVADRVFSKESRSNLDVVAAVYRFLAQGRISEVRAQFEEYEPSEQHLGVFQDAKLAAALAAEDGVAVRRALEAISDETTSIYRQFLVARSARYREGKSEAKRLLEFVENTAPNHLDARIARVDALRREGKLTEALEYGNELRSEQLSGASDFQRATLQIHLAEVRRAQGDSERARRRFMAAVQAEPERAAAYAPLIALLIDRAELESARERLRRAQSLAGGDSALTRSAARLAYLEGNFSRVLELFDESEFRDPTTATLRASALLRQDRPAKAVEFLDSLDEPLRNTGMVAILRILSAHRAGSLEAQEAIDRTETVVSEHSGDPLVQRTAARLYLDRAKRSTGSTYQKYVDRAVELLDSESLQPIERSLHDYLRCECHLAQKDGEEAERACASGRRINSKFLPGMYTVVRLHTLRGDTDRARLLLDGLEREDERLWPITELRVRAALRDGEPGTAREALRKWTDSGGDERPESSYLLALIDFHEGNYEGALERFQNLKGELRDGAEAKLYLAHALTRTGRDTSRAESTLKELNDHAWWSPTAWLVFGELRRRQGRTRDALENLGFAENQFDDTFAPRARLEHLHIEQARVWSTTYDWDYRKVAKHLRKAREVSESSTSPELHLALGERALERRDPDPEAAAQHFRAVLDRQPYRCDAARGLARALREQFDDSEVNERIDSIEPLSSGRCSE